VARNPEFLQYYAECTKKEKEHIDQILEQCQDPKHWLRMEMIVQYATSHFKVVQ